VVIHPAPARVWRTVEQPKSGPGSCNHDAAAQFPTPAPRNGEPLYRVRRARTTLSQSLHRDMLLGNPACCASAALHQRSRATHLVDPETLQLLRTSFVCYSCSLTILPLLHRVRLSSDIFAALRLS
jgi:hypothetical protein